uniref:glycosyltransferase family 2 protein n=1 Tax=Allorhizocola rhizosphaerae TaxID=1872709 RepID=UPI0013C31A54
ERLNKVMADATTAYEIILVVDGSPDNTWEVADSLAKRSGPVRAIRLARNYGQHNALVAGLRAARFEVIVTMDDDLQHPPEEVPKLLAALTDDVDLVYGVAATEEHGFFRNLTSRVAKTGMAVALGAQNADQASAFRAFRAFMRGGFEQVQGPHASIDVTLSWSTTRIAVQTVDMADRAEGRSGYTVGRLVKHALNMALGYSTKPLRLVTYLGFLVGLIGVGLLTRMLWMYFDGRTTQAGFTTIASMIAMFAAAQMVAIGVLGEYVGRIHSGGMGRPTYVIRERTEGAPSELPLAAREELAARDAEQTDHPRPADVPSMR